MLEVSNLNKINPDSNSYLLDNMTFHIPKGHICGLIGENGAGKTTLMRTLMGLYSSSGSIVIDGCDMRLNEAAAKEWLAIFFYPLFQFTNTLHRFPIQMVLHFTYRCYSVNCQ